MQKDLLNLNVLVNFIYLLHYCQINFQSTCTFLDICGIENANSHKIVGGHEAKPNQFPWLVALFADRWFCSASIISDEFVLTAAHCVDGAIR
jgi:secreted trypsin-like serine protease